MSDPRLRRIAHQLERIVEGDLTKRLGASGAGDDIDAVAAGLDLLADELLRQEDLLRRGTDVFFDVVDLFERAPVMLAAIDLASGAVTKANETMLERHGPWANHVVGVPLRDHVSPEYLPAFDEALATLRRGEEVTELDLVLVDAGKTPYAALYSASVAFDDAGTPRRARCTLLDVEGRRRLEEQLVQAQKLEAVGRLAGGVAHDFNNLLTVIQNHVELGLRHLPADSALAHDLRVVLDASGRAARLTEQLLAFSRRKMSRPRVLRVDETIEGMRQMLAPLLGATIDVVLALAPDAWRTHIDPGHLEQVIMNLAVNARDAMPDGGKLTIETANVTLDETYTSTHRDVSPGDYVLLAVSDTGMGMSPEVTARVFEPFFTTKEVGRGTGLGLATCYGIVRQAQGHIRIYSEPGAGTTFRVYLPRAEHEDDHYPVEATTKTTSAAGGTEVILLAEDDHQVRSLAARILREAGYKVLEAATAHEAIRLFDKRGPGIDLLLTDVVLPGGSGRHVARALTAKRPALQVLYFSGYTDNAIVHHGVLDPGVAFLAKPFRPTELLSHVRQTIDRRPR